MTKLSGHTSPETAYLVDDYPYGFRLRCKIRYWLEYKSGKGFRFWSQTTNPKASGEVWNKPKTWIAINRLKTLCDLPACEFTAGSYLSKLAKDCGYECNAKTLVNDNNWWGLSVQDFCNAVIESNRQPSEC